MSFIQKQLLPEAEFGEMLKELRELRGFTYDELSKLTRIHPSIIQALEREEFSELADPLYAERHVKFLVLALEGRPDYFLKKYRALLKEKNAVPVDTMKVRTTVRKRDFFVTSRLVAAAGFFLFAGLACAYLIWQAYLLQDPPPLRIITPVEGARLTVPHVDVQGETAPNALVTVNGQKAVVDGEGRFRIVFDIPRGLTTLTIEASRRYGSPITLTRMVSYER
ncbi:helix-turn-helix domain-containing protein [Patescibacteria group bacterium]|nr:helix-turn-helix domain-containing protein [Patescibacteria group bacterium]MBU1034672.1 helix-turn-helix domain-containing protein [Patescibacteria group bacterium]MBU1630015.1 helix-turn-helix domain-containing protein [Patescibacteria group bacterium]MBU1908322.1 helix-turn-helix domain-containing protein [Patescibacteria group bacterium]